MAQMENLNPHRFTQEEINSYDVTFKHENDWYRIPVEVLAENIIFRKKTKTRTLRDFQDYFKYETESPIADIKQVIFDSKESFESILYSYKMYNIVTEHNEEITTEIV